MTQFIANGLCKGSVFALVALGFGLIYTTSRVFHIAHGAVYTIAAYLLYCLIALLGLPLGVSAVFAVIGAALVGALIEFLVYRPLERKKASSTVILISSLGVYIVLVNILAMLLGNETRVVRSGVQSTVAFGSVILTRVQVAQLVVGVLLTGIYWLFLKKSSLGRTCRAVADDSTLASVLGVRVETTRLVAFAVGSLLAGAGAVLMALDVGMDPYVGFSAVLVAAVACIVGGLHRFMAPALGGVLLGVTQSLVVWRTSARWESAVTFAILVGFLLLKPQGLLGVRKRLEEG